MITLLTGETFQVVYIIPGPHYHFESWNDLGTGRTIAGAAKQPLEQKEKFE